MFKEFDYDNKPIVEIVNDIISDAVNHDASDIHFDPYPDNLHDVRFPYRHVAPPFMLSSSFRMRAALR